jgi:hypothetical protein
MGKAKAVKINNPKGAGRKSKFSEVTTTFSCRVPVSKKVELSQLVHLKLLEWSNKGDG